MAVGRLWSGLQGLGHPCFACGFAGCSFCQPLALLAGQNGTRQGSRTPNLLIRSQVLYPIELAAHGKEGRNHKKKAGGGKYFMQNFPGRGKTVKLRQAEGLRVGGAAGRLGGMDGNRQDTGEWGEREAERHLRRRQGMRLLERRWRHRHGELDLIMRQGGVMVFVEVRVRTAAAEPLAAYRSINRGKWRVLRRTALAYLRPCPWRPEAVRFDGGGIRRKVTVELLDLTHWENVGTFGRGFRY